MIDLDTEFHEIICKASGAEEYTDQQILREHILNFGWLVHIPEIAKKARDGHFEIFNVVKAKDPKMLTRRYSHT
jgi:DNA-binding GntR family transcriptional regulator